jgi:predicted Zn-dependent protease
LIDYYEEQFEYPKALQAIEHALVNYPFSAVFHIRKAQLLLEEDRIDDANSALNFAKLYEPTNVDVILTEV